MPFVLRVLAVLAFAIGGLLAGKVFDSSSDFFNFNVMLILGLLLWCLSTVVPETLRRRTE